MEFNFSLPRLLLLAVVLALFWLWGGFSPPEVSPGGWHAPHRVSRSWVNCLILFLIGAVNVSVVDHYAGNMDRKNLRVLHVILGIGLIAVACLCLHSLRESMLQSQRNAATKSAV